jgi:hypothetical protein
VSEIEKQIETIEQMLLRDRQVAIREGPEDTRAARLASHLAHRISAAIEIALRMGDADYEGGGSARRHRVAREEAIRILRGDV